MQNIGACLWFDHEAEEAANYYVSIFPDSKLGTIARYSEEGSAAAGRPVGSVMTVAFTINGHDFLALNGGPLFKFSEAVSFVVPCDTQEEIDRIWDALTANGGQESQCGWLKDRYGVSWQIVPAGLERMYDDPAKGARVMRAVLKMKKLDMAAMQRAAAGK